MKKTLLHLLFLVVLSSSAFAQNGYAPQSNVKIHESSVKKLHQTDRNKKAYVSGWYSHSDMIGVSNLSAQLATSVAYFCADSNVRSFSSDGEIYHNFWHGFGQVFDPKDDLIDLTTFTELKLSRFNSYYFDSVAIPYCYNRWVDSFEYTPGVKSVVVDTLFVAYYKGNSIQQTSWVSEPKDKVAILPFNNAKISPANYFDIDTFFLSSGMNGSFDSTSVFNTNGGFENSVGLKASAWAAPANTKITMSSSGTTKDGLIGVTFKYVSGIPTVIGTDTAVRFYSKDPSTMPAGLRRTNSFAFRYLQNQADAPRFSNPTFYNSSQLVPGWAAYGQSANWKNVYVAGAGFQREIFVDIDFHLTNKDGIPAGLNNLDQVTISSVYPNPSNGLVTATFETKTAGDVKVEVINLIGQTVKTVNYSNTAAGTYELPMDLSSFNAGVYMMNITVGNSTHTQKFVIAQ